MSEKPWKMVTEVYDRLEAEMLKSALEAEGVPVFLSQEAAGSLMPVHFGELGRVEILVPEMYFKKASQWLLAYEEDKLNDPASGEEK